MAKFIGLDFGTTNSLITVIIFPEDGRPITKSFLNDKEMPHPSVVSYSGGNKIVGRKARTVGRQWR